MISGTFWSGASFKILKKVSKGEIILILSKPILDEYVDVLHRKEIIDKEAYSAH